MRASWLGLAAILVWHFGTERAAAQAWIKKPGEFYLNAGYRYLTADGFYDADGERQDTTRYQQHTFGVYGEVGVIERWLMVVLQGEALRRNSLSDEGATTGVGDFRVGAYTGLLEDPFRLSLGVSVGLPTGDPAPTDDDPGGPDITGLSLPTGDGETDIVFDLAAGHALSAGPLQLFGQAVVGYAVRTTPRTCPSEVLEDAPCDDFTDQIQSRIEAGARIASPGFDRFLLIARVGGIFLLGEADETSGAVGLGDGVSYLAVGPELIVDILAGFSANAGIDFGIAGTNVPAGTHLKFGLAYRN